MLHEPAVQPNDSGKYGNQIFLFFFHVWTIIEMEVRKLRQDPTELVMRGIQPVLWLLIFGQAFSRLRAIPTGSVSYEAFLTPGILAQSITFISIFYGITIIWDRDLGLLQKIMVTPIRRPAFILGKMLSASIRSINQGVIILLLSVVMRIPLEWSAGRIIGVIFTTILGGVFFSGLSMVIASLIKTRERMMGIGQVITMPLFFSSSALYPVQIMPDWLRIIATINPMSYLVDGLRNLLINTAGTHLFLDWCVLIGASSLIYLLNCLLFPRILR
ncbi:ABC-type drug export system membrane protein [Desulfocucumis palustris]|uniref:Transport permease protein n=1 Tax=Desulfocucumis palustris TaxID=1898651 RepID=A0A2L2XAT3_9FIRM|nr:ABC transporter permease [Desulfocucumis palustris]GBF33389.1 ABC-type drug export system membrane protein [Desulfocucumis palustris]